jgi:uncharacterized protein
MRYLFAVLAVILSARPAVADFAAAQAAMGRGDYAASYAACKAAAAAGDARCRNHLGVLYERGLGVARDFGAAALWFRLAARQGLAAAENNLGASYQFGRGVSRDLAAAAHWYRLAADAGDAAAESNLAVLYATGAGVPRNPALALDLLRRAAVRGHRGAVSNLAHALDGGIAGARDPVAAYFWYSIAARLAADAAGRATAIQAGDRLAGEIAPARLAAARAAAGSWRPGQAPRFGAAAAGPKAGSAGSGFIVNRAGDVVTSAHVVRGCRRIEVAQRQQRLAAALRAADEEADLAILHLAAPLAEAAPLRGGGTVQPGESAVVIGFPLHGLLSSGASVTTGIVSALQGPRGDRRLLQITAPVQPGNSGSPLLDAGGAVIGVVAGKLNALRLAEVTGQIPENVNFAVNGAHLRDFLERNGVAYTIAARQETLATPAIAERALAFTVMVRCLAR